MIKLKQFKNIDIQVCKARQHWTPPTVKRIKMCVERLLAINIPLSCVMGTVELVHDMQYLCVEVSNIQSDNEIYITCHSTNQSDHLLSQLETSRL